MASRRIPNSAFAIMWWIGALAIAAACCKTVLAAGGGYFPRGSLGIPVDSEGSLAGAPGAGWVRPRLSNKCDTCHVNVWIGAYSGAQSADSAHPPATPLKIARIINTGLSETVMYNLKPYTQAEYDLVFRQGSIGRPQLVLVEIPRDHGMPIAYKKGMINNCHHAPASFADADFWDCRARPTLPMVTRASLFPVDFLAQGMRSLIGGLTKTGGSQEDPIWFSCTSGCCTVNSMS